ncbi:MAG: helix-turn-helix domain-containing protein [Gammaproteobacteria bacterium]|nr:helix-turn-helix domain-containing protein [Gammaproteobacteria bacterium]
MTTLGNVIVVADIPPELGGVGNFREAPDWTRVLANSADRQLTAGKTPLLASALPEFEKALIRIAMRRTKGHRQEAAKLLGWDRITLTRKMKALHLDGASEPPGA